MLPVAIQLYSLRGDNEKDFPGTLRKVKAMGYQGVEFAGLYGYPADEVKRLLDGIGLAPVSAHIPFVDMLADPEGALRPFAEIGCPFAAIPYLTPEYRPGAEKFDEVIEGAKVIGAAAKKLGMTLCYHNHDFEFEKIDGEYALDVLYREVPPTLLQTELDLCWVNVGGEEPAAYLRKYTGRAPLVHLKDFVMPGKKPAKMYDLIGIDDRATKGAAAADTAAFEFRPLGYGVQDMPALLRASEDAGAQWLIVEQDEPSVGRTSLECAEMSIDYLKENYLKG